ncbi:MAG: tRNA-dihydrouridine synthase [Bacilli bacterium]|nr:tRNA-dihydrouridine synthase [Bacilli bacterium]
MWKIANYEIKGKILLAPMAGFTSEGYRKYLNSFGVDVCVTEMVSDMGLIYGNQETKSYVTYQKDSAITGVQLFGHDPDCLAKAALKALEINPDIEYFDINMGCPVPKVVKTGAGSALLENPEIIGEIIKKVKEATHLPVTAKIRLGYNDINVFETIRVLEDSGVDAIGIHARTRKEYYYGVPNFEILRDLRSKTSVPLIISGNIYTVEDAINALNITGADAVMIARGGIGNPFLITQIKHYFETGERLPNPSFEEQEKYCLELCKSMIEEKGEKRALAIYRSIAPKFFLGYPNAKQLRTKLATSLFTYQNLVDIINEYKNEIM